MHLALFNIARLRAPMDDPLIDDFRTNLDPINALAGGLPRIEDGGQARVGVVPEHRLAQGGAEVGVAQLEDDGRRHVHSLPCRTPVRAPGDQLLGVAGLEAVPEGERSR